VDYIKIVNVRNGLKNNFPLLRGVASGEATLLIIAVYGIFLTLTTRNIHKRQGIIANRLKKMEKTLYITIMIVMIIISIYVLTYPTDVATKAQSMMLIVVCMVLSTFSYDYEISSERIFNNLMKATRR